MAQSRADLLKEIKSLQSEINKIEAVDIDENSDFIIAETLYKLLK